MPSLQSLIAALNVVSGVNPPDSLVGGAAKGQQSEQFSSLLDVLGKFSDTGYETAKKDDVKEPVAASFAIPVPFRELELAGNGTKKELVQIADNNGEDVQKLPSAQVANDKPQSPQYKENSKNLTENTSEHLIQKTAKLESAVSNDEAEVVDNSEVPVTASGAAANLNNILDIITQIFAGASGVAIEAVSVNIQSQLTIVGNDTVVAGQDVTDPLAVLSNLKNILAQLQQFLQGANAQNAPLSDEQNIELAAINEALQNDLNVLKNLLPVLDNPNSKQPLLTQILQVQLQQKKLGDGCEHQVDLTQVTEIADIKSLLQSDISLIKDALQKFKDNSELPLVTKLEVTAAKFQEQQTVIDVVQNNDNSNVLNFNLGDDRIESAIFSNVAANSVVEQAQARQILQTQNNHDALTPTATVLQGVASGDADNNSSRNFSNNSGQNSGNSQLQFSVGGLASSARQVGGAGTAFSSLLNRAEQTPVTEQIVFHVKTAVGGGNSKITIQLHPDDLGKLDITLDVDANGKTGVTITADNKQTLDLLQRDSQGLQKALSDAGLKADSGSLSFNLRGGEREGQGQNQSQAASHYQKSQPDDTSTEEANLAVVAAITRSYTINITDSLDIKI